MTTRPKKGPLHKIRRAIDIATSPDLMVETLWRPSWFGAKDLAKTQLKAFLGRRTVRQTQEFTKWYDFRESDLAEHRRFMAEEHGRSTEPVKTVNWFLPFFHHAFYGGVYTILRFADHFGTRGIHNRILIYDNSAADQAQMREKILAAFPGLASAEVVVLPDQDPSRFPPSDAAIATLWTSAYLVMLTRNTKAKYYFIQDYEPLFYPAGTMYALAEATYRFKLAGIVNTPGLCDIYQREFGAEAVSFVPSVDRKVFHPPAAPRAEKPFRVFFYARPSVPRNAFELGLAALGELKRRYGAGVEIVLAGEQLHPALLAGQPAMKALGLLPFEKTGDLYRTCHAGLSLMLTRHPSYLPFEMMACGTVPVANKNTANEWLLAHQENCLVAEPTASSLADELGRLVEDRALHARLSAAALETIARNDWAAQLEKVFAYVAGGAPAARARGTSPG